MSIIESMVKGDVERSSKFPILFAATYMGDFNLQPSGEIPLPSVAPIPANSNIAPDAIVATRPFQSRWDKIFESMKISESMISIRAHDTIDASGPAPPGLAFASMVS